MNDLKFTVFYDGSCPLCTREISFYKKIDKADAIFWVDVSACLASEVVPGLPKKLALEKFHVQSCEGELISGGTAFAVLWTKLPGFKILGNFCLSWPIKYFLPYLYSMFLFLRPLLQKIVKLSVRSTVGKKPSIYPGWIVKELRSNHAGELGATKIYEAIIKFSKSTEIKSVAKTHLKIEYKHLDKLNRILPVDDRSNLLPIWMVCGYVAGAISAMMGANAVYNAIATIELFVEKHYAKQISEISKLGEFPNLLKVLQDCHKDELTHLNDAIAMRASSTSSLVKFWCSLINIGSVAAVSVSRQI